MVDHHLKLSCFLEGSSPLLVFLLIILGPFSFDIWFLSVSQKAFAVVLIFLFCISRIGDGLRTLTSAVVHTQLVVSLKVMYGTTQRQLDACG